MLLLSQITVVASFRCTGNKSNFYEIYQKKKKKQAKADNLKYAVESKDGSIPQNYNLCKPPNHF